MDEDIKAFADALNKEIENQESLSSTPNQISSQSPNSISQNKQICVTQLLPLITPHVDKHQEIQLHALHSKLRNNVIHKSDFIKHLRNVVSDRMIIEAMEKIQRQQGSQVRKLPLQEKTVFGLTGRSTMLHNSVSWKLPEGKDKKRNYTDLVKVEKDTCGTVATNTLGSTSFGAGKINAGDRALLGASSVSVKVEQNTSRDVATTLGSTSFGAGKINAGDRALPVASSVPVSVKSLVPIPPTTPSVGLGIGKKKALDEPGTESFQPNKKQKVSERLQEEDIDNLNDVTTGIGVDLRKEEEQLFSGCKQESRASEDNRKLVQEEEKKLLFERVPFQKKLAKIMLKCGIKNVDKDVERCLSLCLEERLRGLVSNLARVSKERVDCERSRHRTIVTSDIRSQILLMNRMSKKDLEKTQVVEVDTGGPMNEAGENTPAKINKEEKVKTTTANIKALAKWQVMAEKARQRREGGDSTCVTKVSKPCLTTGKDSRENHDGPSGVKRKFGTKPGVLPAKKVARSISVKDVIAVLEREPQMSKSTLVYRLYERTRADKVQTSE